MSPRAARFLLSRVVQDVPKEWALYPELLGLDLLQIPALVLPKEVEHSLM